MAVIAAFEFDDEVAIREPARHADGGHGRFGARVHQTYHFDGRDSLADGFRQLDFALGGRAEAGAGCERFARCLHDGRMRVAQQQRSPGADVIDILVAVRIEDVRALAARDEQRRSADAAESSHRRIDAARDVLLGPAEKFFGSLARHARTRQGTRRWRLAFIAISSRLPFRFSISRCFKPRYDCVPANRSCMMLANFGLLRVNCTMRPGTLPNRKRPKKTRLASREPNSRSPAKSRRSMRR